MRANLIKFSKPETGDFFSTLSRRVNDYFVQNKISRHANSAMVFKTIVMLSLYFVPFSLIVTATVTHPLLVFVMWCVSGLGTAGIGLSVMHDANHGAYSRKPWVNFLLGYTLNFLGGNAMNWKIQHNVLHHSFTNVDGFDEDIESRGILRFSPHIPLKSIHRFQYIYAWPLYSLMTVMWVTLKEFRQVIKWRNDGLFESQGRTFAGLMAELIISKSVYYTYALVLPLILSPVSWWVTVLGFIAMHLIAGFILTLIFQPAHVVPSADYPLPDPTGNMEQTWAVHQLYTTCNYAPRNKILSWFAGGLNHQIEHHLFPNVCHIHYKNISPIVKETAREYGLPYYEMPTFRSALRYHAEHLYKLGRLQTA